MPDQEQLQPLTFPVNGINLITEFEQQLPNTTSVGLNVRGWEPATQRNRGGSRQGLSKWINAFVNGTGPALIQDLNQLVTLDANALLTAFGLDLIGVPTIPNPNFPGFLIPQFGSGVQLNRNQGSAGQNATGFAGVTSSAGSGPTYTAIFEVGQHNQTITSLSGTGNVASGMGFVAIQITSGLTKTNYFQFPLFAS